MDLPTLLLTIAALLSAAATALLPSLMPSKRAAFIIGSGCGVLALGFAVAAIFAFVSRPVAPPPTNALPPRVQLFDGHITGFRNGVVLTNGADAYVNGTTFTNGTNAISADR